MTNWLNGYRKGLNVNNFFQKSANLSVFKNQKTDKLACAV